MHGVPTTLLSRRARPARPPHGHGKLALLLVGSALLLGPLLAGCQSAAPRRLDAPAPPRASRADAPCARLAERLLGVAYGGQVLAELSPAARPEADEESLAPLEGCLGRFEEPRWEDRPWLLRSLSHAYGLAVVGSSTLGALEQRRRLERIALDDVRAYWEGRLFDREGAPEEAIARYREALRIKPELEGAKLALAAALVRAGAGAGAHEGARQLDEGLAALDALPPEARPALQALIRAEAARARGALDEAAAHYEAALRAEPPLAARSPDGAALASLPLPSAGEIACAAGAVHEKRGDVEAALAHFREGRCAPALVEALLAAERRFDALVELARRDDADPEQIAELFESLGAPESALARRERLLSLCERLDGGARCAKHAERAAALRSQLAERAATPPPDAAARAAARERAAAAVQERAAEAGSAPWLGDAALSEDGARAFVEVRVGEATGAVHLARDGDGWRVEGLSGGLR